MAQALDALTPPSARYDILIVGGGLAGAHTAATLRKLGYPGTIGVLSNESLAPYERPPLSKAYLCGEIPQQRLLLHPDTFWTGRNIDLLCGSRVISLDAGKREVSCGNGALFSYGTLVWATGGTSRRLTCPGADAVTQHTVRTLADADRLRRAAATAEHVVIVGAGFVGLEVAATLRKSNKHVTVLDTADRVLARVGGETLSNHVADLHRKHGVEIHLSTPVEALYSQAANFAEVLLRDGRRLVTDCLVVGAGMLPETDALTAAGALGRHGVDVDAMCRTSLPHVYAVGDCARQPNVFVEGDSVRLECVSSAIEQAAIAAHNIVGKPAPKPSVPWFWSNQYDLRLQIAGVSAGHDRTEVNGDPSKGSFSIAYFKGDRLIALDALNAPKDFSQARQKIAANIGTVTASGDASLAHVFTHVNC
jgi:3-phenylpropionate/trans-cinnamate dioxygenase ferredoxin reductase subunit